MGTIADRTETKWGKFRPYLLWTAVPFGLLLALTFTTPDFSANGKLIYAYVTYILLTLAYTANNVPYSSLTGVMTGNILERTNVSSFRFFGAYLGGGISLIFIPMLVDLLGKESDSKGYQYTFYILAAVLIIFSLIAFVSTRERIKPPKDQRTNIKDDLRDLIKNKPWIVMLIIGFLWVTYNSIRQGAAPFYFKWYIGDENLVGYFFGAVIGASILSSFIATPLTNFFGKKRLFILVMAVSGIFTASIFFLKPENVTGMFILGSLAELAAGIMPILFFAMLGDVADFSEYNNSRRATGLVFSAGTFAMKFGGGVAGAVTLFVLNMFQYTDKGDSITKVVEQSDRALQGIKMVNSFVPVVFIVIAILVILFYPLSTNKMTEIEQELKSRKEKEDTA
ncbi:MAG: glycoside-pentoside-hexuronide (GPH):cation symporter, partial [Bacteroidales bacterium]|jgi:GPH family glycoside/pentoside/hexuronide:cation symporter